MKSENLNRYLGEQDWSDLTACPLNIELINLD